jgi:uncharacterized protein YeaO (DUF488 family)
MLITKRVYEPADPADGLRVLVMRLWPRGIAKNAIDLWLKDLGAERELLREWKAGRLTWSGLRRRYLAGLERPEAQTALATLRSLAGRQRVTLLCACPDENRCHRGLLRVLIERRTSKPAAPRPARRSPAPRRRRPAPRPRQAPNRAEERGS